MRVGQFNEQNTGTMTAVALPNLPTLAGPSRRHRAGKGVAGLISLRVNPAHKCSPLIVLSGDGRKLFHTIETREDA